MSSALSSPGSVSPARSPVKKAACSNSSSGRSSPVRCHSPANKPAACSPLQHMGRRTGSSSSSSSSMTVACLSSSLAAASISSGTADTLTGHYAGHSKSPSQLNSGCVRPLSFGSSIGSSISRPWSGFGLMHSSGRGAGIMCNSASSSSSSSSQPGPSSSDHLPRPVSPVSTAEAYTAAAPSQNPSDVAAPYHHSSSSTGGSSSADAMSSSAAAAAEPAAAAAVLTSVGLLPSNGTAARAAAAEAEAAVTATTSVADMDGQLIAAVAAQAGLSLQAELQDLFTLLKFQVSAALPSSQQAETLMAIVKHAAADRLPIAALMTQERLLLLLQLLRSKPSVAVLAAEVFCRVSSQDIEPWAQQLLPVVTELLAVVQENTTAKEDGQRVPLVFFAVSALVRLSAVEEIAGGIVQAGGVPVLVAALNVSPPAVCQVNTFSLFRLMREVDGDMTEEQLSAWQPGSSGSSGSSSSSSSSNSSNISSIPESSTTAMPSSSGSAASDLLLLQYVRQGAFNKLCEVMAQVQEGSAHELAFSMLLSMALIPQAQQLVADRDEVQSIVKVLTSVPSTSSTRLEAMLVLARLAARCVACQQDAVREGVVPVLVSMMQQGSDEERCHAARLLAILGQHASTHQVILRSGALQVVLRLLRDRGHRAAPGSMAPSDTFTPDIHQPLHVWQAAHAVYNTAVAAGMSDAEAIACSAAAAAAAAAATTGTSSSSSTTANTASGAASGTAFSASQGTSVGAKSATSAPAKQEKQQQGSAAAAAATSTGSVGPSLVLEQAVGVVCMLCHNPDNHFGMVGDGLVPLLVSMLHKGTHSKTLTYTLASLLMLATAEPRHAAVVARTGAVPMLVSIARESCNKPQNRELAAALLAVLCRSQDVQVDVIAAAGIVPLSRLLTEGTDGARCYACEALVQIAAVNDVRCQLVVYAGALQGLRGMMEPGSSSLSLMWGARLLKTLAQDSTALQQMCQTAGLIPLLREVLSRRSGDHWSLHSSPEAAAPSASSAAGSSRSSSSRGDLAASVLPAIPTVDGVSLVAADREVEREGEGSEDIDLEKAQAQLAWLVAALSNDISTRRVIAEVGSFLVRPLVVILRDSQAGQGSGYSLTDVLDGLSNSRQAAAAAALRAMGRADDRLAAMINAELALQLWLGHRVELPRIVDDWPSAPAWY